jgi:hypothetical protein
MLVYQVYIVAGTAMTSTKLVQNQVHKTTEDSLTIAAAIDTYIYIGRGCNKKLKHFFMNLNINGFKRSIFLFTFLFPSGDEVSQQSFMK